MLTPTHIQAGSLATSEERAERFMLELEHAGFRRAAEPAVFVQDMGLFVSEDVAQVKVPLTTAHPDALQLEFPAPDGWREKVKEANARGAWIVITLSGDPTPDEIGFLKRVSDANDFSSNDDLTIIPQHKTTRIAVITTPTVFPRVSYPYFATLFGVITQ